MFFEIKNENQTLKIEKGTITIGDRNFSFIGWNLYRQQAIITDNVAAIVKTIKQEFFTQFHY
jgi:hypothetical protein